jgi:hypothetical protein
VTVSVTLSVLECEDVVKGFDLHGLYFVKVMVLLHSAKPF